MYGLLGALFPYEQADLAHGQGQSEQIDTDQTSIVSCGPNQVRGHAEVSMGRGGRRNAKKISSRNVSATST